VDRLVGAAIPRVEDARLVSGAGSYVDDLRFPGMLHAALVRSRHAHARIVRIDSAVARAVGGVVGVWTAADLDAFPSLPARAPVPARIPHRPVLARDVVRYVGEGLALVVASDRLVAADAAELVEVEYESLQPVLDPEEALKPGAPLVHPELGTNEAYRIDREHGDVAAAFARAAVRVHARTRHPRLAAVAIEPRGVLARPATAEDALTVWTSTQSAFNVRELLAPFLELDPQALRVVAPDVGGAFGAKNGLYPEEVLIPWVARRLGRPVKWIEGRSESMVATTQGRGLTLEGELAARADGTILALRASILGDAGAYLHLNTAMPPIRAQQLLSGCYRIPAIAMVVQSVFTHRPPTGPYRGAGRPEGNYLVETLLDELAAAVGEDPAETRKRNFIAPGDFPYASATGMLYDTGNYRATLDRALEMAAYGALRAEKPSADGRLRGIGLACFVETAGVGPETNESGRVAVERDGQVTVHTGSSPHGQGHETTWAQLVGDELGVPLERVRVLHGDTGQGPRGTGTFGSRSGPLGGSAALLAGRQVRGMASRAAAHLLEAREEDLTFAGGRVLVAGTQRGIDLAEIARRCADGEVPGLDGLQATQFFSPTGLIYPFGAHVAVVDIDRATGAVRVVRYVAVDDCGNVINPLIVEGQIQGGVGQGLAEALYEEMVFDGMGQPQTGTLMDYGIPCALDLPPIETDRTETPTPLNPLGAKGVGESGTIGAPIAVANAVRDALRSVGAAPLDPPFLAHKVWQALSQRPA
jgi:carbon-monoxide dehydrogenase large subunit